MYSLPLDEVGHEVPVRQHDALGDARRARAVRETEHIFPGLPSQGGGGGGGGGPGVRGAHQVEERDAPRGCVRNHDVLQIQKTHLTSRVVELGTGEAGLKGMGT